MRRVVYIPAIERHVPLSAYVRAVKMAKAEPDREFKTGLTTWWSTRGSEVVRQFRHGIHERINEGIPAAQRGR